MKYLTKTDIFVISLLLAVCLLPIFGNKTINKDKTLLLLIDNRIYELPFKRQILNLKKEYGVNMVVEIDTDRARIIESDCPQQICVKYGWVEECGEMSVCVPNKTAIQIKCEQRKEIDGISQ